MIYFHPSGNRNTVANGIKFIRNFFETDCTSLILSGATSMMIGDEGAKILADSLCSTETLTTLRLDDNGISDEGAKTIFEALKYNTTLTTFGMINSPIGDDAVSVLSDALKYNTTLTNLRVSFDGMTAYGDRILLESIMSNEVIKEFCIIQSFEENEELYERALYAARLNRIRGTYLDVGSYNATIKESDNIDELEIIFKDLRANIKIKSIDLSGSKITPRISEIIRNTVMYNESITRINLSNCGLDDSNSQLLCGLVTKNNIKELDLYGNSIQIGGARNIRDWLLADSLKDGDSLLTVLEGLVCVESFNALYLYGNKAGDAPLACEIGNAGIESIGLGVRENTSLVLLNLSENLFGPCGNALSNIVRSTTLTTLELRCGIDSNSASELFESLDEDTPLKHLTLSCNKIDSECCGALSNALKKCKVCHLLLNGNEIGDIGARKIGRALSQNMYLEELNLRNNKFGDDGCKGFSYGLKANTCLKNLDLGHNSIGDVGAIKIGKALKYNDSLGTLSLSNNKEIGDAFAVEIYQILKKINKGMKTLSLDGTAVSQVLIEKLVKAMNVPAVLKKPVSRGGDPRTGDDDSDSDSDDEDVEYEPSSKQSCPSDSVSPAKTDSTKMPFMLLKSTPSEKEGNDEDISSFGHRRRAKILQWRSTDDLCKWVNEMFPRCSERLYEAFHENNVSWDTLCGETPESLIKYGLQPEEAEEFYKVITEKKLFLVPDNEGGSEYMTIEKVLHELKYDSFKLDKVREIFEESKEMCEKYTLSVGDFIVICLYTLNYGACGKTVYSLINESISSRHAKNVYRWYIFHLLFALRKLPCYKNDGALYRGIPREVNPEKYEIGKSRKWLPFTSTSKERGVAEKFLGKDYPSTLFEIKGPVKGYDIKLLSRFCDENEVILEPYFTFTTTAIEDCGALNKGGCKKIVIESEFNEEFFIPDGVIKKIALREPMENGWWCGIDEHGRIFYSNGLEIKYASPNYTNFDVFLYNLGCLNSFKRMQS